MSFADKKRIIDTKEKSGRMIVYEFYLRDKIKGDELIGVLPERRNKKERVNHESIMKWIRTVYKSVENIESIFYVQVNV